MPGASTTGRGDLHQQGGDKSTAWQTQNSQYFVIGWRCVMNKTAQ